MELGPLLAGNAWGFGCWTLVPFDGCWSLAGASRFGAGLAAQEGRFVELVVSDATARPFEAVSITSPTSNLVFLTVLFTRSKCQLDTGKSFVPILDMSWRGHVITPLFSGSLPIPSRLRSSPRSRNENRLSRHQHQPCDQFNHNISIPHRDLSIIPATTIKTTGSYEYPAIIHSKQRSWGQPWWLGAKALDLLSTIIYKNKGILKSAPPHLFFLSTCRTWISIIARLSNHRFHHPPHLLPVTARSTNCRVWIDDLCHHHSLSLLSTYMTLVLPRLKVRSSLLGLHHSCLHKHLSRDSLQPLYLHREM